MSVNELLKQHAEDINENTKLIIENAKLKRGISELKSFLGKPLYINGLGMTAGYSWQKIKELLADLHEVEPINKSKKFSNEILATLTPREEKVIKMYQDNNSFEDIAKHFEFTLERVQQIFEKAVRKLNHPRRANLKRFQDE